MKIRDPQNTQKDTENKMEIKMRKKISLSIPCERLQNEQAFEMMPEHRKRICRAGGLGRRSILFVVMLLVIGTGSILAREYRYGWLDFGSGMGAIHGNQTLAHFRKLTYQDGRVTYTLRSTQLAMFFDERAYGDAWDIGLLYGRALTSPESRVQVSAGIGLALTGMHDEEWENKKTIGIPVDVQMWYRFSRSFGMGFYFYLNSNSIQSFTGVGFTLRIGKNLNKGKQKKYRRQR